MYVSTEPYCGIRSFLSVFFSRLALQHDKTSSAFLCLPAVSTSTAQVAGAHGFLGREIRAGNDDSLWKGYRREGEAGQMKFNNCDLDIQLKKQQPKSVIQVSCSSLQGDCTKETVPRQRGLPRHCTTHSCEIILSKCVNMQNRSLKHFSSSPLHDCNVPPPPFCAAQPAELCCPNSSGEPARNSFSTAEGGQQNPCQTLASYLPPFAHLTKSAGLGWK